MQIQRIVNGASPAESNQEVGPTIIAVLNDGPLRGIRIEAQVVEGRPPSTVDVRADDEGTCRYCLAEWTQSGPSGIYLPLLRLETPGV